MKRESGGCVGFPFPSLWKQLTKITSIHLSGREQGGRWMEHGPKEASSWDPSHPKKTEIASNSKPLMF
jgi:hypothetical protein